MNHALRVTVFEKWQLVSLAPLSAASTFCLIGHAELGRATRPRRGQRALTIFTLSYSVLNATTLGGIGNFSPVFTGIGIRTGLAGGTMSITGAGMIIILGGAFHTGDRCNEIGRLSSVERKEGLHDCGS